MKKLQILVIILLILLSIGTLAIMPAKAQTNNLSQFVFNTLSTPQTAGSAFTITITAKASNGNTITSYTGTNTLTVSSGTITPTATTAFVAGVWTGQVKLSQAGTGISILTSGSGKSGTSNKITINPGVLDRFIFNTISTPQTIGKAFSVTITAKDANSNTVTSYTGTNTLTSSSGTISPTGTSAFVAGVWTGSVSLSASSSGTTISTSGYSKSGTSNLFTVNAGALDHFVFSSIGTQTASTSFSITITAKDASGNTVTSYTGSNTLSASAGTISPTITGSFSSGIWTGSVTLSSAGSAISISTSGSSKTSTSNSFTVNSLSLDHYVFNTINSPQTAGSAFTITITAKASNGNTITSYTGKPTLSISTGTINPTVTGAFSNGVWTGTVTTTGAGSDVTIMATEGSHSGVSNSFNVNSGVANGLVVSSGTSQVAGVAFSLTVTAKDVYGNIATSYTGRVHFSSSDAGFGVSLPSDYKFQSGDLGIHNFINSVTLVTIGTGVSVTATDTATGSIAGSQTGLTITRAGVVNVVISPSGSSVTAGASKTYSATASDAFGNSWDVTSLTIWNVSSDAGGRWSGNVFSSAVAGTWTITGTYGSIAYTTTLTVNPSGLDHFTFNTVTPQITGSLFGITITAKDTFNNTVTSYAGWPSLTYSAGSISPTTIDVFVSGVGSTSVTVNVAGSNVTIKATDSTHSGTSNSFSVNPTISASAGSGGAINPTGNVCVNYWGSQSFNITANTGYSIADVIADNISLGPVSTYTFTGVQATHTITAIFGINTFNISVSVGAGGSISPSGSVSVNYGDSQTFIITPSADYYIVDVLVNASSVGAVNSYTFTNVQTSNIISAIFAPTPTPAPSPTATQNPAPTQTPKPPSTPTQTPSPTPLPKPIFNSPTLQATLTNGSIVDLEINGITALAVTNATISTDPLAAQTTLSLTIIGQNITNNVNAITVPKTTVNYGATPKIYVNSQMAPDQGFSQDANNYYVWYKTIFSDYELSIVFAANAPPDGYPLWIILSIVILVFAFSVTAVVLSKKKKGNCEDDDYSTYG
jgi:hypothetical protein